MKRYRPSAVAQARLLEAWENRCAYCRLPFGLLVWPRHAGSTKGYYRTAGRTHIGVALRLEWDHFVPFTYTDSSADDQFVPACHLCNHLKASSVYRTLEGARETIEPRWIQTYELASGPVASWAEAFAVEAADYAVG